MPDSTPRRPLEKVKKLSPQAWRTLRRRRLRQQTPLERQISLGRPDTTLNWCGQLTCIAERVGFDQPMRLFVDRIVSKDGLLVINYHKDFVKTTVEMVFPNLVDFTVKAAKLRAMLSFVDSPPIRAAFWRWTIWCQDHGYKLTGRILQNKIMGIMNSFIDLMFGTKTLESVERAHYFLQQRPSREVSDFDHILLQFLLRAELWRRHETCRSSAWTMGTPDQVAEFLTALAYNYWLMYWDKCFEEREMWENGSWDAVWDEWLDAYPITNRQDAGNEDGSVLVVREELESTEEDLLERVGYLGGIGKFEGASRPVRRKKDDK